MSKKFIIIIIISSSIFSGCSMLNMPPPSSGKFLELDSTDYLLSCISNLHDLKTEEFAAKFQLAEKKLNNGSDQDKLHFICLSLTDNADYEQFRQGAKILEQYISAHPNSPNNIDGLMVLVDRIDKEIETRWSSWKSLLEEKKGLTLEVENLQKEIMDDRILIEKLQQQIEQLKNIENIIENRNVDQQ